MLVKYDYPPDQTAEASQQVMDQMESMAPGFAEELRRERAGDKSA